MSEAELVEALARDESGDYTAKGPAFAGLRVSGEP